MAAFPDGVYFVGLAGIASDTVDSTIAEGMRVRPERERSLLDTIAGWLRDRQVLLVVDNCEEVSSAAQAAITVLSARCHGLHVLATSRVPLGVAGELRVPLPPLDQHAAIELFADRMAVTRPTFDPAHDQPALEELCRRLDGFPLALELAAARCRTLTPGQLLGALGGTA